MLILRLNNTFDTMAEEKENIIHKRPEVLECDVVRFQNEKEKWIAFVGLLNGKPYEIFTGLQDDDEGIILPKSVNSGKALDVSGASKNDGANVLQYRYNGQNNQKWLRIL